MLTFFLLVIAFLKWIASWRMQTNACWYVRFSSSAYISTNEFCINCTNGFVFDVTNLQLRTNPKYKLWKKEQMSLPSSSIRLRIEASKLTLVSYAILSKIMISIKHIKNEKYGCPKIIITKFSYQILRAFRKCILSQRNLIWKCHLNPFHASGMKV